MLDEVLPAGAAVVEVRGDVPDAILFPEEKEVIGRAVEKRRREFRTGRACARAALAELGVEAQAIPSGPRGAPQWPAGIVGSITHCDGYRACALAHRADLVAIGIDAELDTALPEGLIGDIALPEERRALDQLTAEEPGTSWDRLLFSAKEAVYKAWFPLTERWLGFEDARVEIDRERRFFSAQLLVPGPRVEDRELRGFSGRWLARDGLLLAAIGLAAGGGRTVAPVGGIEAVGEE
jgi:4'-phosphopantetheinyl transferase EntD